jgi:ribose-phosphate pyrophosphokinase
MKPLLVPLPGNEALSSRLASLLDAEPGSAEFRRFPDDESYIRLHGELAGRSVVLVSTLDRPDPKFLPLSFVAATARELGASRVGLIAPYLAYMRQDRRFHSGEATSAGIFARHLSGIVDWLITVDPHLHRVRTLSEMFGIPAVAVHASAMISRWIRENVKSPVLIGPDEESAQWVSGVATEAEAPYTILKKIRHGDRAVEISVPHLEKWHDHTPVLVDDIISTGRTMAETIVHLRKAGMKPALCIAVHAVFAPGSFEALCQAGAERIVTTNTISHATNAIAVETALAAAARPLI